MSGRFRIFRVCLEGREQTEAKMPKGENPKSEGGIAGCSWRVGILVLDSGGRPLSPGPFPHKMGKGETRILSARGKDTPRGDSQADE